MKLIGDTDGVRLRVRVQPRAHNSAIRGIEGDALNVHVTSPPVGGAANRGLRKLLAKTLDIPPSRIEILTGHTSRRKTVKIIGLSVDELRARLVKAEPAKADVNTYTQGKT